MYLKKNNIVYFLVIVNLIFFLEFELSEFELISHVTKLYYNIFFLHFLS